MDGECSIVHQKTRPGKLSCQETWWFCKNSVISRIEVLNIHVQFRQASSLPYVQLGSRLLQQSFRRIALSFTCYATVCGWVMIVV